MNTIIEHVNLLAFVRLVHLQGEQNKGIVIDAGYKLAGQKNGVFWCEIKT